MILMSKKGRGKTGQYSKVCIKNPKPHWWINEPQYDGKGPTLLLHQQREFCGASTVLFMSEGLRYGSF